MNEELDDLARHLRQSAGDEIRAEAAEDEELTQLQRLRHRDLAEAARASMHRGDRVTISVAGVSISHVIESVGEDYLTMASDEGWIDVRLAELVMSVSPRTTGGRSGRPEAATFRARLAELEQERAPVELAVRDGSRWTGRVEVLGADHVVLAESDGRQTYVPAESVLVVFSRFPPRRS